MAGQDSTARTAAVRAEAERVVAPLGLYVEDVTVTPAGKRRLVQVLVDTDLQAAGVRDDDTPVEPLALDRVAEATSAVSAALDETDVMGQAPYVLEVSSPGTDRPLTRWQQFRRNVGRTVRLDLRDGARATGRLVAADADGVTLQEGQTRTTHGYDQIAAGRVEVEFTRPDGADQEDR